MGTESRGDDSMTTQAGESTGRAAATMVRTVTAAEIAAYRDAVSSSTTDGQASPVHAFVLGYQVFDQAVGKLVSAGPDGGETTRVHLSQEIRVQRLLRPDERVTVEVDVLGARREAKGIRLGLRTVLVGEDGSAFAELVSGVLAGGATEPEPFGEIPPYPVHRSGGEPTVLTRQITVDMVRRYAEVSGDDNPIHLDDEAARAAGFTGVIAHGMSVLARVCEEVIERYAGGDASRVRGIGTRFSAPVLPGEPLEITLQPGPETAGDRIVSFSCRTPGGVALKGGWAEIAGQQTPDLPDPDAGVGDGE